MKFKDMKLRYKVGVGVVTGASILGMAGGAFAYITGGSGGGSGTATPVTSVTENDLSATATVTGLAPGAASGTATTVAVTNGHAYSIQFGKIHLALDTVAADWPAGCSEATAVANNWFTIGSDTTGAYTAVPGSSNSYTGPTVKFNDDQSNDQTGCLGKAVPLVVTLSAS